MYSISYAPKAKNYGMWVNLLENKSKELVKICANLLEPISPIKSNNRLYLLAKNLYIETNCEYYKLLAIYKKIKEEDVVEQYENAKNLFYKIEKLIDVFVWSLYFPNNTSLHNEIKINNLLESYNSPTFLKFSVLLNTDGYLNIFLLNNSTTEKTFNLYPDFPGKKYQQENIYLKGDTLYDFPLKMPKDYFGAGKSGYPFKKNPAKEIEKCSILFLFSKKEIPGYISKSQNIVELEKNWKKHKEEIDGDCYEYYREITFK
jgi:hypothetical protein